MTKLVVLGAGPGDYGSVSLGTLNELESLDVLIVRTMVHPSIAKLCEVAANSGALVLTCDPLYEVYSNFDALYREMARWVGEFAFDSRRRHALLQGFGKIFEKPVDLDAALRVGYLTPGSPNVAEKSVDLLRESYNDQVTVLPAVSFLDLALLAMNVDPFAKSLWLVDADDLISNSSDFRGNLLISQVWNDELAYSVVDVLLNGDLAPAITYLHHLGLVDQCVKLLDIKDLASLKFDHLTSIYVEDFKGSEASVFMDLTQIVARLRTECPWDKKQTHTSLGKHLIEEAYEVIEAITQLQGQLDGTAEPQSDDEQVDGTTQALADEFAGELGDLFVQVLFHAQIASESGLFDLYYILNSIKQKLIRRHPHVFAGLKVEGVAEVLSNWESIKRTEKVISEPAENIPKALPALLFASKVVRKADAFGYKLPERDALVEEIIRCADELTTSPDRLGELIFSVIKLSKLEDIDLEAKIKAIAIEFSASFLEDR